jgi:hypothetical protein
MMAVRLARAGPGMRLRADLAGPLAGAEALSLVSAAAAFLSPARDLVLVGSGLDQQVSSMASAGFFGSALVEAKQDPGSVGEEVGSAGGGRGNTGQRLAFLLAGELAEMGVVACSAVDPGEPEPVGIGVTHVTTLGSCARFVCTPHRGGFPDRALSTACWRARSRASRENTERICRLGERPPPVVAPCLLVSPDLVARLG